MKTIEILSVATLAPYQVSTRSEGFVVLVNGGYLLTGRTKIRTFKTEAAARKAANEAAHW